MKSQFRRLLKLKERLSERFYRMRDEINSKYDDALRIAYKAKFPRRKWIISKSMIDNADEHNAIFAQWRSVATRTSKNYYKARDDIEAQLKEMAPHTKLYPTDLVWSKYYVSDSYTYASQGWGARKYAMGSAESRVLEAAQHGLESHVVIKDRGYNKGASFTVWVNIDGLGVEILKRRHTDLVAWVRQCWASGTNPRVYCPFLPHGFEEKHGLDYFGNKK